MSFKVGDKVKLKNTIYPVKLRGAEGVVKRVVIHESFTLLYVLFDGGRDERSVFDYNLEEKNLLDIKFAI